MTPEERGRKVEFYGNAYAELAEALQQFPSEMWHYRDEHGCWSIHEHILHIADSEANSYIRCRRLIAEPGETLMAYDENRWAVELDYHQRDTEDAIQLFRCLRQQSYALIKSLPESVWSNTAYHPENGNVTLDDWLDVYERHITEHVGYMQENYAAWVKERNKT